MHCLLAMNQWNNRAGNALTRAIIMVSNAVKNSLQGTPNEFAPEELVQVWQSVLVSWCHGLCAVSGLVTTACTQMQHSSGGTGLCTHQQQNPPFNQCMSVGRLVHHGPAPSQQLLIWLQLLSIIANPRQLHCSVCPGAHLLQQLCDTAPSVSPAGFGVPHSLCATAGAPES